MEAVRGWVWIFSGIAQLNKIRKKENGKNVVWFYPERALQKAISKSTVEAAIVSANKKQGQSSRAKEVCYVSPRTQSSVQSKEEPPAHRVFVFGSWKDDNGFGNILK